MSVCRVDSRELCLGLVAAWEAQQRAFGKLPQRAKRRRTPSSALPSHRPRKEKIACRHLPFPGELESRRRAETCLSSHSPKAGAR